ncbi:hypothetical protein GCM10009579_65580 [Streptomyces javensis]|uniref:Uncharacterized protein n=1 Tax=Streptomyces javensis TaxID=114698 RepID=A0ABP4HVT1_9ACTN
MTHPVLVVAPKAFQRFDVGGGGEAGGGRARAGRRPQRRSARRRKVDRMVDASVSTSAEAAEQSLDELLRAAHEAPPVELPVALDRHAEAMGIGWVVSTAAGENAPEVLRLLIHAILDHRHGELSDDATILMLEWRPPHP